MHVPVVFSMCAANAVLSVWRILLSNDVEVNPGPLDEHTEKHGKNGKENGSALSAGKDGDFPSTAVSEILAAIQLQTQQFQLQFEEQTRQQQKQREEQASQNQAIREELRDIKHDLTKVTETCEEINRRCSKLENEDTKLHGRVDEVCADVDDLYAENSQRRRECVTTSSTVQRLREEISQMSEEIDRLEEFSRRDNLRLFGLTPTMERQDEADQRKRFQANIRKKGSESCK
ncbi:hypothetical protein ACOMHN_054542 [Nucella lapillus]